MMDSFDEKHKMIQMLLDMLKGSAAKEVSDGMKPPEGMPDAKGLEIDKVAVIPHKEGEEIASMSPEGESLADSIMAKGDDHKMSEGGMTMDEPKEMPLPMDEEDMEDESPVPAFSSFMGKRKKK